MPSVPTRQLVRNFRGMCLASARPGNRGAIASATEEGVSGIMVRTFMQPLGTRAAGARYAASRLRHPLADPNLATNGAVKPEPTLAAQSVPDYTRARLSSGNHQRILVPGTSIAPPIRLRRGSPADQAGVGVRASPRACGAVVAQLVTHAGAKPNGGASHDARR